jgi:hypothetical protein
VPLKEKPLQLTGNVREIKDNKQKKFQVSSPVWENFEEKNFKNICLLKEILCDLCKYGKIQALRIINTSE